MCVRINLCVCFVCVLEVFRQGDEGKAWYVIMQGAVSVETYSKGVVETLREGEDFGGLALIHNVPRYVNRLISEIIFNSSVFKKYG